VGAQTAIEWTDATWNPIGGCTIHTPGCTNCYAMRLAASFRLRSHPIYRDTTRVVKDNPVWTGKLTRLADDHDGWSWPLSWRGAKEPVLGKGKPSLIFVGDMSDLFHERRSHGDIDRVIAALVHSRHIGQLLTKRPDVMHAYFAELCASGRLVNFANPRTAEIVEDPSALPFATVIRRFWLGASVERQQEADGRRRPMQDLAAMGFTTFVSYEPALGPVDWAGWEFLRWLISGGESGPDARPSHPHWHRQTRDWCARNGTAYFFKQWGEWSPGAHSRDWMLMSADGSIDAPDDRAPDEGRGEIAVTRLGKKGAGRLLDGVEHNGFPAVLDIANR
jgi:protein gp37